MSAGLAAQRVYAAPSFLIVLRRYQSFPRSDRGGGGRGGPSFQASQVCVDFVPLHIADFGLWLFISVAGLLAFS